MKVYHYSKKENHQSIEANGLCAKSRFDHMDSVLEKIPSMRGLNLNMI